ncbi:hypothetical protein [Novosphingobium sp. P6W]|uniref:hypothetical protein n=1 Tax=Novosphingobium sp. P6W TaxID=1609758 RepID=UPI0005C2B7F5|nr:hypothetical protein [Novosphingobium sp. P6W]AXB77475.1 hypothetical protein TQ38_014015 [Novosphingobium sp. P6W]KIS33842.1 hypothetical protein TQ38_03940 [Novosphingobium sp. P6W]
MSLSVLLTAALLGQSAFSLAIDRPTADVPEVAYRELSEGNSQAAVRKLEANGAARSEDPATLINLGAAYARAGQGDRALAAYRAAVATPERYDLELADGTWMDSRQAARAALKGLTASRTMAAR